MSYGRGVCDTDPIPIGNIEKSCRSEGEKSATTVMLTMSIDDAASTRYSTNKKDSLIKKDYFFENSETLYNEVLNEKEKSRNLKLAGPFTEPPNPGKQMKLGEYCAESSRRRKDL